MQRKAHQKRGEGERAGEVEGARGRKLKYSKLNRVEEEDYDDDEEEEDKDERNGHNPDAFCFFIYFLSYIA